MRQEVMSTRPAGTQSLSKLPFLFGSLLICWTVSCKKPSAPLLRVRIGGCNLLVEQSPRPLCAATYTEDRRLIFAVEGPPLSKLSLRVGNVAVTELQLSQSGQATINEPYPAAPALVSLRTESLEGVAEYTVDVAPRIPYSKAVARNAKIDCEHASPRDCLVDVQRAISHLDANPKELDAKEQAFLIGLLGKQAGQASQAAQYAQDAQALRKAALPLFERAMVEARATGLLSVEAWALDRLGKVLRDQGDAYDPHLVAAKLSDPVHARALSQCPEAWDNVLYLQSLIAEDLGDPAASKRYASEATALAETFSVSKEVLIDSRQEAALAAQLLQESTEAERLTEEIGRQLDGGAISDPCPLSRLYNTQAWTKLVARQTGHPAADPEPWFQRVATWLPRCKEEREAQEQRAVLLTNRALYAILRAEEAAPGSRERLLWLDDAEASGREAQGGWHKATRTIQIDLQLDLSFFKARSALLRGKGEESLRAFVELEKLTTRERLTPYYRWASQVGQADASRLLGNQQAALASYARAEALLDRMTDELSLSTRRQLFLKQFEAGTGRYIELLLESAADASTVLGVIRHARVRALRAYTRGPGAAHGPSRTQELLALYRTRFAEREAAAGELVVAPLAEMKAVQGRLRELQREQQALLENLYTVGPSPGEQRLRPPAAGELLIACYPLPAHPPEAPDLWLCAGASTTATKLVRIPAPTPAAPEQAAQALLAALGELLPQAFHLRILPYGPLRAVAWAALPFASGRLEDRFSISYGVDLPPAVEAVPTRAASALLVTNPQQDLHGAQRAGQQLRRELRAAGWKLAAYEGAPRHGGNPLRQLLDRLLGRPLSPVLAKDVIAQLFEANLFIYYGHAESSGAGGWDSHLRFAEGGRLSAQDVMALSAAPQKVLLIGCETAVSDRDAPADEAGLAQAFVLRGSEAVLATTRKVADETAEALVGKLAQLGALRPGGPPLAAALREAIASLRSQQPAADLDAFRVYTP